MHCSISTELLQAATKWHETFASDPLIMRLGPQQVMPADFWLYRPESPVDQAHVLVLFGCAELTLRERLGAS